MKSAFIGAAVIVFTYLIAKHARRRYTAYRRNKEIEMRFPDDVFMIDPEFMEEIMTGLHDRYMNMLRSSRCTREDWQDFLSECEYAERLYLYTHPYIERSNSTLSEDVRKVVQFL